MKVNWKDYMGFTALYQLIAPGAAFCFHELGTACTRAGGAEGADGAGAVVQTWIHNCWVNPWGAREIHWAGLRVFFKRKPRLLRCRINVPVVFTAVM